MPTLDAANHRRFYQQAHDGLTLDDGDRSGTLDDILTLIAERDVILGTGHLGAEEIHELVRRARLRSVRKILVTHPEAPFVDLSANSQIELRILGCLFERTWVFTTPVLHHLLPPERIIADIKRIGFETTVLATDMGQVGNPLPVEGLRAFVHACLNAGFTESQVHRMGAANIAQWLMYR